LTIRPIIKAAIQANIQRWMETERLVHETQALVNEEIAVALAKFPPFNSPHEGFAVLKEAVDELWEEVRRKGVTKSALRAEAVQVAAMAQRFLLDMRLWDLPEHEGETP
jgi:hypothetical protein